MEPFGLAPKFAACRAAVLLLDDGPEYLPRSGFAPLISSVKVMCPNYLDGRGMNLVALWVVATQLDDREPSVLLLYDKAMKLVPPGEIESPAQGLSNPCSTY